MKQIIVKRTMRKSIIWAVKLRDLFYDNPALLAYAAEMDLDRLTVMKGIIGMADMFLGQSVEEHTLHRVVRHLMPTSQLALRDAFYDQCIEIAWKLVDMAPEDATEFIYITTTHGTIYIHLILAEFPND